MDTENREKGSALVIALLLTATLVALGSTFLVISYTDRNIASNRADGSRALFLADAGIERARAQLEGANFDALLAGGGGLFNNQALGGGTYTVTVANNTTASTEIPADGGGINDDTDGFLVVNATGRFQDATRRISVYVRQTAAGPPPWPFPFAAFGATGLSATGGAGSSEFYGAVGTNANISFSGGMPKVHGDASAVGTIPAGGVGWVTGTAQQSAPAVALPAVNCPAQPWGPAPLGTFTLAATGKLTINSADVVFPSGTYYFSEISKSGGGNISIQNGANVQIFVSGKIAMSGGGWNNPNGTASSLQFWGCGTTSTTWTITGPQESWFTMYAPRRSITFTGAGNKRGSFIGSSFSNSGPGSVYWDAALATPGATNTAVVDGTWTEVW